MHLCIAPEKHELRAEKGKPRMANKYNNKKLNRQVNQMENLMLTRW